MPPQRYDGDSPENARAAKSVLNGGIPSLLISPFTNTPVDAGGSGRRKRAHVTQDHPSLFIYQHDSVKSTLSVLVSRKITSAQDALEVAPPVPYTDVEGEPVCCLGGNGGSRAPSLAKRGEEDGISRGKRITKSVRNKDRNWRPCKTCSDAKIKCELLSSGICSKCDSLGRDKCPPYEPPAARPFSKTIPSSMTNGHQGSCIDASAPTPSVCEQTLEGSPSNLYIATASNHDKPRSPVAPVAPVALARRSTEFEDRGFLIGSSSGAVEYEAASSQDDCPSLSGPSQLNAEGSRAGSTDDARSTPDERVEPPPISPNIITLGEHGRLSSSHSPDGSRYGDQLFASISAVQSQSPTFLASGSPLRTDRRRGEGTLVNMCWTPGPTQASPTRLPEVYSERHDEQNALQQSRAPPVAIDTTYSYISELSHALTPMDECFNMEAGFYPVDAQASPPPPAMDPDPSRTNRLRTYQTPPPIPMACPDIRQDKTINHRQTPSPYSKEAL